MCVYRLASVLGLLLLQGVFLPTIGRAQVQWWFDFANSDANITQNTINRITDAMDEAVNYYNAYSNYALTDYTNDGVGVRVIYNSSIATANAGYKGRIAFGGSISARTAMHELGHVFGVGTFEPRWNSTVIAGRWTGPVATAELQRFNGPGATVNGDGSHFWPYGLNFGNEDSPTNRYRHVRMVGALREDMRLRNGNATDLLGDYNNDGTIDAADYTVWRDRLGEPTSLINDRTVGSVEPIDYTWWVRVYGQSVNSSVAVPEPGAFASTLLGLAALAHRRRSRSL